MFSTDGALKTTTIPINTNNNTEDGKLHISRIQRLELKNAKTKRKEMNLNERELR